MLWLWPIGSYRPVNSTMTKEELKPLLGNADLVLNVRALDETGTAVTSK